MTYELTKSDALIIVDPQNDFCPGGALAVEGGDQIMPGINELADRFYQIGAPVVVTQDWHPTEHKSFASAHGQAPFSQIEMPYGEQTLWPDHCVQGTPGAAFAMAVMAAVTRATAIVRKGMNPDVDSYSAFYENDKTTSTGLGGYLKALGVTRVFVVGLAYDYCVAYTAIDASWKEQLEAIVVKDLTRAISPETAAQMENAFIAANVKVVERI